MKPKYKWLEVTDIWTGEVFEDMSWTDEIPSGWYTAFGEQMIDELNEILVKNEFENRYQISQIKEKWGELRWYDTGFPDKMGVEFLEWLDKYEDLSSKTCIKCGEPATHVTRGWIMPMCDKCDVVK